MRCTALAATWLLLAGCTPATVDGTGDVVPSSGDDTGSPPAEEVDDDGDGWSEAEGDCDDADPDVHPGGDEGDEADGVDQDCDGVADDRTVCDDGLADHATIQEAVDAAPDGFVLLVCPGTYRENVVVSDRRLTIRSTDGPEVTTIDGGGAGPAVSVENSEGFGLDGFTVTGGAADYGGGLLAVSSEVAITGNVFEGSVAALLGGGLMLYQCTGTLADNVVRGNEAPDGGGAVVWEGQVAIEGNTFEANVATTTDEKSYGAGGGGGGLFVTGDSPVRDNAFVDNESLYNGGGLFLLQHGGEVTGNTFEGNLCHEDGGGVYTNWSTATFSDNVLAGNEAWDDAGGMRVYVGHMTITGNVFTGNVAADDGGGLKLSHASNTIEDDVFEGNVAGDAGGGVELDNETSSVSGCTFSGNAATRGGGLHSWRSEGALTLSDLVFEDNEASDCGGAIQLDNDPHTVTLRRIVATGNAAGDGGALCIDEVWWGDAGEYEEASAALLENALFVENTAVDDGGAIYVRDGKLSVVNATLHGNSGGESGAISVKKGSVALDNAILTGHAGGVLVYVAGDDEEEGGASFSARYSDFHDNEGGFDGTDEPSASNGNITADPEYADPASGDFSLAATSPCIDAGDPAITDRDGSRSDMGWTGGPEAP